MPLISVIIPTYGDPDKLERAISSALEQSFSDIELIVVDDNNPDTLARERTAEIMKHLMESDSRVEYLCHDKNRNGAAARNTGIGVATGKYIAFLDADDEYMPKRLEKCVAVLENMADETCAGVYTGCEFRRSGKIFHVVRDVPSGNFLKETLACTFMFCTGSNIFMRADVVKELKGFDEAFMRHQDYEFLVRYFKKYSLIGLNEVLVIKNNENRNLPNPHKIAAIKEQYLNKYQGIIGKLETGTQKSIYCEQYEAIAEAYAAVGNHVESKVYYHRALEYNKISLKRKIKLVLLNLRALIRK